jgi:hypothetical protein
VPLHWQTWNVDEVGVRLEDSGKKTNKGRLIGRQNEGRRSTASDETSTACRLDFIDSAPLVDVE